MLINSTEHRRLVGPGGVRELAARWVFTGVLTLESACHLGNGESNELVDMPLARERSDGRPLLTGSSFAGALRSHVNDLLLGYELEEAGRSDAALLFGGSRGDEKGEQSPLIVFDARAILPRGLPSEIRDGVAIDSASGTAEEHFKFDMEVLPAGTTFPLRLELLVADPDAAVSQVRVLVAALEAMERGEIRIGARRSRGLGLCRAGNWRVRRFDLTSRDGWMEWLAADHERPVSDSTTSFASVAAAAQSHLPGLELGGLPDRRNDVEIDVELHVRSSLLVRSPGLTADSPDAAHLKSGGRPVLPGTSVVGSLRARALRIARVVRSGRGDAEEWVNRLFGPRRPAGAKQTAQPRASRLRATEQAIEDGGRLRPVRIRIDRFTGGVVDGALFDEEPHFGGQVSLRIELRNPRTGEVGLVLLLLKDLLTGDLPLGGTSSVGRGVVIGRAEVRLHGHASAFILDPPHPADADTIRTLNGLVEEFHSGETLLEAS